MRACERFGFAALGPGRMLAALAAGALVLVLLEALERRRRIG